MNPRNDSKALTWMAPKTMTMPPPCASPPPAPAPQTARPFSNPSSRCPISSRKPARKRTRPEAAIRAGAPSSSSRSMGLPEDEAASRTCVRWKSKRSMSAPASASPRRAERVSCLAQCTEAGSTLCVYVWDG
jgi:hypothetical protein